MVLLTSENDFRMSYIIWESIERNIYLSKKNDVREYRLVLYSTLHVQFKENNLINLDFSYTKM